jgi:hypothetical protein
MNKPNDWDAVSAYGEYKALPAGGYICKVMNVEESESKGGYPMIRIFLDIAEGTFANYFADAYRADTRDNKKWGCIVYQLTQDYQDHSKTSRGLKTFVTSVEESNKGFAVVWGDRFAECFKNKYVGCIFRREQYIGDDGKERWNTKPYQFRSVDTIRKGVEIPEDKYADGHEPIRAAAPASNSQSSSMKTDEQLMAEFQEVISEQDLPF